MPRDGERGESYGMQQMVSHEATKAQSREERGKRRVFEFRGLIVHWVGGLL